MKRLARGIAWVTLALALVTGRVLWSSRHEWAIAEDRLAAGDPATALDHFGRAARMYAPGNPWSRRALERLEAIARAREAAAQPALALAAWRELRSSVLATRGLYTPNRDRLARADERIAWWSAALEAEAADPSGADQAARRQWHAERLSASDEPSVGWSVVALLGFFLWVAAAVVFLLRAVDPQDRLRRRPAIAGACAVAAGIALFLLGLARA